MRSFLLVVSHFSFVVELFEQNAKSVIITQRNIGYSERNVDQQLSKTAKGDSVSVPMEHETPLRVWGRTAKNDMEGKCLKV